MTGPEHYREAERICESAAREPELEYQKLLASLGQVHAMLALAAASALGYDHIPTRDYQAWAAAAATPQEVTR